MNVPINLAHFQEVRLSDYVSVCSVTMERRRSPVEVVVQGLTWMYIYIYIDFRSFILLKCELKTWSCL